VHGQAVIEPVTAIEICRFLHDSALLSLWGAAAFIASLLPRPLVVETLRRLGIFPVTAALIVLLTTIAMLPLEAAMLGDGWSDGLNVSTLQAVLLDSPVGTTLQVQMAAGVMLLLSFFAERERRISAVAAFAALGIGALALTGHASMDGGWRLGAHRVNDTVHLLSGGAWLGALIPFLTVLRLAGDPEMHGPAQVALRRFSLAGHVAVALVLVTGLINTGLVLGRWPTDWSSPYQLLLSIKIATVCAMVGLATINRYVFVPAISDHSAAAVRAIRIASLGEILLAFAAIGLVAVFGMVDPG
jgi:putative copper resistance protein D